MLRVLGVFVAVLLIFMLVLLLLGPGWHLVLERLHFVRRLENPSSKTVLSAGIGKWRLPVEADLRCSIFRCAVRTYWSVRPRRKSEAICLRKGLFPV